MGATVSEVAEAFHVLYEGLRDRSFSKSLYLDHWSERELLPLVRTFLLGWFGRGRIAPEIMAALPGKPSGKGRIDFLVDGVAVELAVRRKGGARSYLSSAVNSTEVKKLMKYKGLSLLVLFDLTNEPLDSDALENFRDWPSLGKGNHTKSAFNVSYHYRDESKRLVYTKINVRV